MKKLIVANWKLNPSSLKDAVKLASKITRRGKNTVVVCPPTVFLSRVSYPNLGAQDCFWQERGAFTGQVSPSQLKSLKVKYCIIGHSEMRKVGETDNQINLKLAALLAQKIIPILCIGYGTTAQEDDLEVVDVLKVQLEQDLKGLDAEKVIVAYEPIWAIGTGKTPSPEHAEKIALFIKTRFHVSKVLYGGSANVMNAKSFLSQENIDGLLVGGESLIPNNFNSIINM
jgi:triosephosphate isomerase